MSLQLSIVICTHKRFEWLKLAIESTCNQTAPKNIFEVVVVDNDISSNNEVIKIVDDAKTIINIRYIHEPVLGLSQARNTGGKTANSDYIGYIDDDAKAPANYIETAIGIINSIKPDIFGGPYYPFYLNSKPRWFKDEYESGKSSDNSCYLKNNEFINGTNMIFRKQLLESLHWFDTNYGMEGSKIAYGEETNLQLKAHKIIPALTVYYNTDLFVFHLASSIKLTIKERLFRAYRIGYSQSYLWINESQIRQTKRKALYRLTKTIVNFIIKGIPGIVFRNRVQYPYWQNYVCEVLSQYFRSIGQEWHFAKDLLLKG